MLLQIGGGTWSRWCQEFFYSMDRSAFLKWELLRFGVGGTGRSEVDTPDTKCNGFMWEKQVRLSQNV